MIITYNYLVIDGVFEERNDNRADQRKVQDRTDIENERAGRETGRTKRFLSGEFDVAAELDKRRSERSLENAILESMRLASEFAERLEHVRESLRSGMMQVDQAVEKIRTAVDGLNKKLADLEDRAAKDPDGNAVFYDVKGRARYADGSAVDPVTALAIIPPDNAPSFEEWTATQNAAAEAQDALAELEHIRDDVLAPIAVEIEDEDNLPSPERVDEIEEAVEAAKQAATQAVSSLDRKQDQVELDQAAASTAKPDLEALGLQ